tara:strand:- start:5726 stop:8581 length:2856 start_codon:yes stop_codon:yes gene_type:complete
MPKSKFMQSSFVSGELSPLLKGRVDLDQYYQGMETAENVLIVPQGGLKRRAGTQHVDVAEKIIKPFIFSGLGQLFTFTVTSGLPIVGATYTNNSSTFTVLSFTGSGLPYTVYAERTVGTNDPTASGTLTKTVSTPNLVYSAFTTFTSSMPRGGTVANINDFDRATVGLTTTNIGVLGTTGQTGADAEYIVALYNVLGTTDRGRFIDVKDIKLSGTGSGEFKVQISGDGVSWTTKETLTVTEIEQSYRIRLSDAFVGQYYRIVRTGDTGDLSTLKIQLSEFNVLYPTATASDVKTFDFSIETDRHYLCVVTGGEETTPSYGNVSIYRVTGQTSNFTPVAYLPLPFRSSQVAAVRDVQTENVMLMFHQDHAPIRIINTSTTDFGVDVIPFLNVPQYDYNDSLSPTPTDAIQVLTLTNSHWATGDRFQIDVEGVLSKNITYAGDSTGAEQNSTVANIQRNLQEMPSFGDTGVAVARIGAKQYRITISGESTKPFELFSGFVTLGNAADTLVFTQSQVGVARKENVWSDNRGYPKTAAFYSGRLWFGGTKSKPQSLFASRSGSFFDFYTEEGDADEGLFITISSRQLTEIIDINPDRGLQVFTAGAEFVVSGSTPVDITILSQTQHGASYLEVKSVDGATLFIDQNGRTLRSFLYNFNEDAYNSTDISVLSSQLIDNPLDLGVLSGSLSEDANWVFIVNQDGTSAILNTLRSQDINGFTKWINGDTNTVYPLKTVSVSVVKNDLFLVNKRITDTTTSYTIEKWDFDYLMDSSVKLESSTSMVGNNLFLASNHLNGETVSVVARGTPLPKRVVQTGASAGYIVLTDGEKSFILEQDPVGGVIDVEVGYNFTPKIKSMPLNTAAPAGQNQMRQKKITRINLRVYKSSGVYIDDNPVAIRQFGSAADSPLNENLPEQTGVIQGENSGNGWNIEVQPIITVPEPTPFHIQAIEYEVESS